MSVLAGTREIMGHQRMIWVREDGALDVLFALEEYWLGPFVIFWYRASGEPWMYLVFGTVLPEYQIGISPCCGCLVAISWCVKSWYLVLEVLDQEDLLCWVIYNTCGDGVVFALEVITTVRLEWEPIYLE